MIRGKIPGLAPNFRYCLDFYLIRVEQYFINSTFCIKFSGVAKLCERNQTIKELYLWGISETTGSSIISHKVHEHTEYTHNYVVSMTSSLGHNLVRTQIFSKTSKTKKNRLPKFFKSLLHCISKYYINT